MRTPLKPFLCSHRLLLHPQSTRKDCERIPLVERTTNPRRQREGKPDVITVLPGRSAQAAQAPTISIPYISVDRITKIAEKHGIDSGSGFVKLVRSYWMLKRRSRHGVPLLRRLQANHPNSSRDADRETRLKFYHLRQELEKARMLVGQTLRRERMKRELVDMRESIFLLQACPLEAILHCALDSLERRDRDGVFLEPIDLDLVRASPPQNQAADWSGGRCCPARGRLVLGGACQGSRPPSPTMMTLLRSFPTIQSL